MKKFIIFNYPPKRLKLEKRSLYKKCVALSLIFTLSQGTIQMYQLEVMKKQKLEQIRNTEIHIVEGSSFTVYSANVQNKDRTSKESEKMMGKILSDSAEIIGIQESTPSFNSDIQAEIEKYHYQIVGEPRLGHGVIGKFYSDINESNNILSKEEIVVSETFFLPFFPHTQEELEKTILMNSFYNRIVTHAILKIENIGFVHMYNTHLGFGVESIQKRQMEELLKIIKHQREELNLPIILTGDFNTTPTSINMEYFVEELKKIDVSMVELKQNTYKGNNDKAFKQLDYVFVSNCFKKESLVIDSPYSDHDIVKVKLTYHK